MENKKWWDNPLLLPEGSVRGLIALILVIPFSYGIYKAIEGGTVVFSTSEVIGIVYVVINAYFISKKMKSN